MSAQPGRSMLRRGHGPPHPGHTTGQLAGRTCPISRNGTSAAMSLFSDRQETAPHIWFALPVHPAFVPDSRHSAAAWHLKWTAYGFYRHCGSCRPADTDPPDHPDHPLTASMIRRTKRPEPLHRGDPGFHRSVPEPPARPSDQNGV